MRRATRLFLTWLLLLALPLQGWAMAARACHVAAGAQAAQAMADRSRDAAAPPHASAGQATADPAHARAQAFALASAHETSPAQGHAHSPVPHHMPDDASPDATPGHAHHTPASAGGAQAGCSHCAACCVGAVLISRTEAPTMAPPRLPPPDTRRPTVVSFLTDGQERPPRTF